MIVNLLAILFALVLSIAHYLSEEFHVKKNKQKIISFGAGVLLAYVILDLFPKLVVAGELANNFLFLFVLLGFSLLHLVEKYIYQHSAKEKRLKELREAHSISFFIYYLIIGIILFNTVTNNVLQGLLLFIPLLFHTTLGTVSFHQIHYSIAEKKSAKLILSLSPLIGVLLASYIKFSPLINQSLLSLISGVFLYIVTREVIPKENKGNPLDFILGMSVYTILIISTWLI